MKRGSVRAPAQVGAEEFFERLAHGNDCRIERIVSRGHCSPEGFWYDQEEREWVMVISGRARLQFADPEESVELGPGEWIDIPAHRRHRVAWTAREENTIWLAVFYRGEAEE